MITNEGRIEYRRIVGFEARQKQNGWYHILMDVISQEGTQLKITVCHCTSEEFLFTWKGIRSLAQTLTDDNFTIVI